ncbi:MAG: macro domain-containing protein [Gammaproteobacteria bacterium]|nr:macro domain-containing protein [Gammaproteobacteria bacterium]
MIEYKKGDIFELAAEAEALVNTVNCVGVMGRGVALQFKRAFPDNFKAYARACKRGDVRPGKMFVFETGRITNPRYIINFPTKRHWRGKSRIEDIDSGLTALAMEIRSRHIDSIVLPPLGSGLGALDWAEVRPRIEAVLGEFSGLRAVVFEPGGGPADGRTNRSTDVPRMTAGRAALVTLMDRYLQGLLDPFITLLEAHKLLYFMQAAGEPLRLQFSKGHYGPYAENLRHVLRTIEGHLISGYSDGGDQPGKPLELVPGALEDANAFLAGRSETQRRLDRVSHLVEGFESPFGMELLSTVHWVATKEGAATMGEVAELTYAWGPRKDRFSRRQLVIAKDLLHKQGWLTNQLV